MIRPRALRFALMTALLSMFAGLSTAAIAQQPPSPETLIAF